ncbi:MAG TPA: hypothetical protein PLB90_13970, partial [Opitutaceae bacterium]|nr:hypothetical protein [Opitutaceae bacterium]
GGGARVVALVAGGIGDGADTQGLGAELANLLTQARAEGRWTPAVLGPNFLGHWVPGAQLDTSFIPAEKLEPPAASDGGLALLSQSGAFLLCRRSRAPWLRFGFGAALGNQLDAALPDFLRALVQDPACRAVATYVEGFGPGHLVETADAAEQLRQRGVPLLMLRGGSTRAGQAAAATHTGAMAGDCDLERALLERIGVKFAPSVAAFDAALEWLGAVALPQPHPGPVALLTNAGFESVNGSDLFGGRLEGASLSAAGRTALATMLEREGLTGLVTPQAPLDLTPMAGESAFLAAAEILLQEAGVLVIGLVPFTRRLHTDRAGAVPFAQAVAALRDRYHKPVAIAVDAGLEYESYRGAFRGLGLPVFDRVETALLGLKTLA